MTMSDPSLTSEISTAASSKNCHSIDAPVFGGDRSAKNGTLVIFARGDKIIIDRLNPIFAMLDQLLLDLYSARILNRDFEAGFYVNYFVKELGIYLKEYEKMGIAVLGLAFGSASLFIS